MTCAGFSTFPYINAFSKEVSREVAFMAMSSFLSPPGHMRRHVWHCLQSGAETLARVPACRARCGRRRPRSGAWRGPTGVPVSVGCGRRPGGRWFRPSLPPLPPGSKKQQQAILQQGCALPSLPIVLTGAPPPAVSYPQGQVQTPWLSLRPPSVQPLELLVARTPQDFGLQLSGPVIGSRPGAHDPLSGPSSDVSAKFGSQEPGFWASLPCLLPALVQAHTRRTSETWPGPELPRADVRETDVERMEETRER